MADYISTDPARIRQIMDVHLKHPEISVQAFMKSKFGELSSSLQTKKKIYLDTCFWIRIRDAERGLPKSPTFDKILQTLRKLVAQGKVICPISDVTFLEILSQTDPDTRNATAILCDELSCRVALRSEKYRMESEIETFLRDPSSSGSTDPLTQVWVRPCFIFGDLPVPYSNQISEDLNRAFQKSTLDSMWESLSFLDMSKESNHSIRSLDWSDNTANKINVDKVNWEHEIPSFKKALTAEIQGILSVNSKYAGDVGVKIFLDRVGSKDELNLESIEKIKESMHKLLCNSLIQAPAKVAPRLPTTYVHALCHAAVRYDKKRKFNGNLIRDFHHATAGIPYFDAMLTEKPLHVLLTAKHVNVNSIFPCQIVSDENEALQYLNSIN